MSKKQPVIPQSSPLTLLEAGRTALREVPKLRGFVYRGFFINYLVFVIAAAMGMGVIYYLIIDPFSAGLATWGAEGGFFASLLASILEALLWVANLLLMAGTLIFSFLFSLALMSIWYEALAARIVAHWRQGEEGVPDPAFSLGALAAGVWRSLWESVGLLIIALFALALGFIPVIGPVLIFLVDAYLIGWEVRNPYMVVREPLDDDVKGMRKGLKIWTIKAGSLPVALAMIPFVGWITLPALMIYLVAGTSWLAEEKRASQQAK